MPMPMPCPCPMTRSIPNGQPNVLPARIGPASGGLAQQQGNREPHEAVRESGGGGGGFRHLVGQSDLCERRTAKLAFCGLACLQRAQRERERDRAAVATRPASGCTTPNRSMQATRMGKKSKAKRLLCCPRSNGCYSTMVLMGVPARLSSTKSLIFILLCRGLSSSISSSRLLRSASRCRTSSSSCRRLDSR